MGEAELASMARWRVLGGYEVEDDSGDWARLAVRESGEEAGQGAAAASTGPVCVA